MEVISRRTSSSLNPNAPLFVPWAYRAVEDFSDQWWELVQSTAWYRDYWLQECFEEPQNDLDFPQSDATLLPDIDAIFDEFTKDEEEEGKDYTKDMISLGALKWRKNRGFTETAKHSVKTPKIVNMKVSPRPIQQPR